MLDAKNDTIVALSTPAGEGAIGIVRLSGPEAIDIVAPMFRGADLTKVPPRTARFGKLFTPEGQWLDEVVVTLFRAPHSYTGEDVVEISCHGSVYILTQVLNTMTETGARLAAPGEFTMRAFLNAKMDLSQAEAVADLIASRTQAAHAIAANQLKGGISDEIESLRKKLIEFASLIELELDFGEEDVEFADRSQLLTLLNQTETKIQKLLKSFRLGNAIKRGVATVIVGRPNAGKSTLLNTLLKEERAIVSDIPGTTRDTIRETLNINGIEFRLTDTAGIREAQDAIEATGIERTFEEIKQAVIVLYIYDAAALGVEHVQADLEMLAQKSDRLLVIANKADLLKAKTPTLPEGYKTILISAKDAEDGEKIKNALFEIIGDGELDLSAPVLSNARHVEALQNALQELATVRKGLASQLPSDLVALDIRRAIYHLGTVTGEISTDDLLDSIFRNFCIGK